MGNVQQLVEDDDLNKDNPVFQQALLFHHILPHRWITEMLAQLQVREHVEIHGLMEIHLGHSHFVGLGSREAFIKEESQLNTNRCFITWLKNVLMHFYRTKVLDLEHRTYSYIIYAKWHNELADQSHNSVKSKQ